MSTYKTDLLDLRLGDCMNLMRDAPDNHFDLAIVDPPYGIDFGKFNRTNKDARGNRYKANKYKNGEWDNDPPCKLYFEEVNRCSRNQIIWGGNYFPNLWSEGCKGFIFWHKHQPVENFSKGELAWTSFDRPANCFDFRYFGGLEGGTSASTKIHPTQKPVALYNWLLHNYAKPGDHILDTHMGSGSIAIACHYKGFHLTATELDPDYFESAVKRIRMETAQTELCL